MLKIKYIGCVLGGLAIATLLVTWHAVTDRVLNAAESDLGLKQQVERLELRVAALEAALKLNVPRRTAPNPYGNHLPLTEPRYWSKEDFNGQPVYIIPLGDTGDKNKAATTIQLP